MKASEVIAERLKALGFEVLSLPRPNPWWRNSGYRSSGTCCWWATLKKDGVSDRADVLCWFTMAECTKAPVERWDISFGPNYYGSGWPEWTLDIKPEKE